MRQSNRGGPLLLFVMICCHGSMRWHSKMAPSSSFKRRLCLNVTFVVNCFYFKAHIVECKYIKGELNTTQNWAFITRFCFLSEKGTFRYVVEYPLEYTVQNLLLYYDAPLQWNAVYKTGKSCRQKEKVVADGENQIIRLSSQYSPRCTIVRLSNNVVLYRCVDEWYFITARERWWYIALSNCNSTKGLYLRYYITMLNDKEDSHWFAQFSADEFYILHMLVGMVVVYFIVTAVTIDYARTLRARCLFHTTYKLFLCSVFSHTLGVTLLLIAYNEYAKRGVEYPKTKLWGQIFQHASVLLLLMLVLLIGKGYTVTRGRLRRKSNIRLSIFLSVYCLTYVILFIYQQEMFDPGKVLYLYDSMFGYGILILRFCGWLMFIYAVIFTLKHHPEKAPFYFPFFMLYSSWFLAGPVIIIISNNLIDKWVREKVVNGVEWAIALLGHLFFLILTRPSAANRNFPFHIRTSQITAMELSPDFSQGGGNIDNFSRHPYAVNSKDRPNAQVMEVFVVSTVYAVHQGNLKEDDPTHLPQSGSQADLSSGRELVPYTTSPKATAPPLDKNVDF